MKVLNLRQTQRYEKTTKSCKDVVFPDIVKYNGRIGGIDKSDMLTHLYKKNMRARRFYMKLFGYIIDLCICNALILSKRECISLVAYRAKRVTPIKVTKTSLSRVSLPLTKHGQKASVASAEERLDATKPYLPQRHYATNKNTVPEKAPFISLV